jgi:serine/threonine protein kinase
MFWIVMEYARDGDLFDYLQARKTKVHYLPEDHIMAMFVQIALALDFLHSRHILVGDLRHIMKNQLHYHQVNVLLDVISLLYSGS